MTDNRIIREQTDRGTTFTFPGGTKCNFGPGSRSELFAALEKLYTLEQAMADGRLVMEPRKPYTPPRAEILLYGEGGDHA